MNMAVGAPATLRRLRQNVAKIEGQRTTFDHESPLLPLGIAAIDGHLHGGLSPASLHEISPVTAWDVAAASGFAMALAASVARARHDGETLWIRTGFTMREAGDLYGPGCGSLGLPVRRLLTLTVPRPIDGLWAMEEALRSRALAGVVAELPDDGPLADLTATRRLVLAAREGKNFGFLLRHKTSPLTSSADTRWQVAGVSGERDRFGGLGRTAWMLSLVKNRRGATGCWRVVWNRAGDAGRHTDMNHETGDCHESAVPALSLGVATTLADRPDHAPFVRAG
jgi:protein ImuA